MHVFPTYLGIQPDIFRDNLDQVSNLNKKDLLRLLGNRFFVRSNDRMRIVDKLSVLNGDLMAVRDRVEHTLEGLPAAQLD